MQPKPEHIFQGPGFPSLRISVCVMWELPLPTVPGSVSWVSILPAFVGPKMKTAGLGTWMQEPRNLGQIRLELPGS